MKVYYMNDYTNTVITLDELSKLPNDTRIVANRGDREISYTLEDIYKCRDWKVYTLEDNSLTIEDVRELMEKVDKNSLIYKKLEIEECKLLNAWIEEITDSIELERSLF